MNYKDIIDKVSVQLNLPSEFVEKTYKAYWKFIRSYIENIPLKQDLTEEEFNKYRTNINIPSLGKLYCTYDRMLGVKKRWIEKMDKLLKYKSQIEENKKHLSHREWAEILGISKHSFAGDCRSLNIDINTNYKTATRLKSEEYKRKCFQYKSEMEVNNQNWCKSEWAQFLNVSWNAVDRFCESENITLPNKRNRSKKL